MSADPIRAALERLVKDIEYLADHSSGVVELHQNGDLAPWAELLEQGAYSCWLGDALAEARAALDNPDGPAVPEGREPAPVAMQPSDDELFQVAEQAAHIDDGGLADAMAEGYPLEVTAIDILEICRAVLARWGRPALERLALLSAGIQFGYQAGHNDTVEACYGSPEGTADDYADELLQDLIDRGVLEQLRPAPPRSRCR